MSERLSAALICSTKNTITDGCSTATDSQAMIWWSEGLDSTWKAFHPKALCSANNWHPSRRYHNRHFQWLKCSAVWTNNVDIVPNTPKRTLQHPNDDKLTITGTTQDE